MLLLADTAFVAVDIGLTGDVFRRDAEDADGSIVRATRKDAEDADGSIVQATCRDGSKRTSTGPLALASDIDTGGDPW